MKVRNRKNNHASWGHQKQKMSKRKFIDSEMKLWTERRKRLIGHLLAVVIGGASVSAISWGVAEAVSNQNLKAVETNLISLENSSIDLATIAEEQIDNFNQYFSMLSKVMQFEKLFYFYLIYFWYY